MKGAWAIIVLWTRMWAVTAILWGIGLGLVWRIGESMGPPNRANMPPLAVIAVFWGLGWMLIAGSKLGHGMSRGPGSFLLSKPVPAAALFPAAFFTDLLIWFLFFVPLVGLNPRARATVASFDPTHPASWALVFGVGLFYGLGTLSRYAPPSGQGAVIDRLAAAVSLLRFAPLLLAIVLTVDIQMRDMGERSAKPLVWEALPFIALLAVPLAAAWAAVGLGRSDIHRGSRLGKRALLATGFAALGLLSATRAWLFDESIAELADAEALAMGDRTVGIQGHPRGLRRFVLWQFVRDLETGGTHALPSLPGPFLEGRASVGRHAFAFAALTERWYWPALTWGRGLEVRIQQGSESWWTELSTGSISSLDARPLLALSDDGSLLARSLGGEVAVVQTRTGREVARFGPDASGIPFHVALRTETSWMVLRRRDGMKRAIAGSVFDAQNLQETPRFILEGLGAANIRIEGRAGLVLGVDRIGRLAIGDVDGGRTTTIEPRGPVFGADAIALEDRSVIWGYSTAAGVEISIVKAGVTRRILVAPPPARFDRFGPEARAGVIAVGVTGPRGYATHLVDVSTERVVRSLQGIPLRRINGRGGWTWTAPGPGSPGARLLRKADGSVVVFDVETGAERSVLVTGRWPAANETAR